MLQRMTIALAMLALAASPAGAHGGGGGGGHGGGRGGYTSVYISGGVSEVPPAVTGDTTKIHTVAIVSAIGQTLTLGRAGLLATHKDVDIADIKLDDVVDSELRKYLAGRFTFVDVPYDRAALAAIPNGKLDSSTAAVHAYLAALPGQNVDAFIVVRPDAEGAAGTPGLSLLDASDTGAVRPSILANYEIDIVDAKDLKVISHTLSRVTLRQGDIEHFAALLGSADLNISPQQTPTDVQRVAMKKQYSHLLSISLIETLRSLNLGVALPPPGARVMVPIPPELQPFPKMTRVAVISAIGDELDLNHRAPFFVHTSGAAPIADWNLDDAVEADVRGALDKRLTVKQEPADRAKIAKLNVTVDQNGLATVIDGLQPASDVDAYIVVLKRKTVLGLAGDPVTGLALSNQTSIDSEHTAAFAMYEIALVDPHTFKPMLLVAGRTSPAKPVDIPSHVLDNAAWPKDGGALSPDQVKLVQPAMTDILADSIPETLMRMGLTGMMPSGELPPAPSQTASQ